MPLSSCVGQWLATTARAPAANQARVSPISPEAGKASPDPELHPLSTTIPVSIFERVISSGVNSSGTPEAVRLRAITLPRGVTVDSRKCAAIWIAEGFFARD